MKVLKELARFFIEFTLVSITLVFYLLACIFDEILELLTIVYDEYKRTIYKSLVD